jgi:hypothetical protein
MADRLFKRGLKRQIASLSQHYEFAPNVTEVLESAREARNTLVHEITVGIERDINKDDGREQIIKEVETTVRKIAEGDCIICFLLHLEDNDVTAPKIENYCDKVANWVCEVEENP